MLIRKARAKDLPRIAQIHIASWQDAYQELLPREYLRGKLDQDLTQHWAEVELQEKDVVLLAGDDEPLGFIAVWCRPEPYIENLHVLPLARGQGIGTALLAAAAEQLIRQGQNRASLRVLEGNLRAIRFYQRLGGAITERASQNLFGHLVYDLRIEWNNLSSLLPE